MIFPLQHLLSAAMMVLALLAAPQARADALLTLSPVIGNTVGPQSTSNPCVIAGTNCGSPATFRLQQLHAQQRPITANSVADLVPLLGSSVRYRAHDFIFFGQIKK